MCIRIYLKVTIFETQNFKNVTINEKSRYNCNFTCCYKC